MNLQDITKKYILTETELTILETIINELTSGNERISIRSLANKTYVSTTVIIKLAKKLGFIGYSQMIYVLNENIHQKVSHEHTYLLSEFVNDQDVTTLMKLVDDLYKYRKQKIYLVGIGFSDIISQYFLRRLAEIDIFAYGGAPIDCINADSKPSIIILFSKSGETEDLIQVIKLSKKMGHTVYAITTSSQSTISKLADYHIELKYKHDKLFDIPDYYVATSIFMIENILAEFLKKDN